MTNYQNLKLPTAVVIVKGAGLDALQYNARVIVSDIVVCRAMCFKT